MNPIKKWFKKRALDSNIIFGVLNSYVYNDENTAGEKLLIIDADDIPIIVEKIVKQLEANNESD